MYLAFKVWATFWSGKTVNTVLDNQSCVVKSGSYHRHDNGCNGQEQFDICVTTPSNHKVTKASIAGAVEKSKRITNVRFKYIIVGGTTTFQQL